MSGSSRDDLRPGQAGGRARAAGLVELGNGPRPVDCGYCEGKGYTNMAQHWGHLGFAVYLKTISRCSIRYKIKMTGRPR